MIAEVRRYDGTDHVGSPQRERPQQPMDEGPGQELACHRIRVYLVNKYEDHGAHLSRWWHALSRIDKTGVINKITDNTLLTHATSPSETASMLRPGKPEYISFRIGTGRMRMASGICSETESSTIFITSSCVGTKRRKLNMSTAFPWSNRAPFRSRVEKDCCVSCDPQVHHMAETTGVAPAAAMEQIQELIMKRGMLKGKEEFEFVLSGDLYHLSSFVASLSYSTCENATSLFRCP